MNSKNLKKIFSDNLNHYMELHDINNRELSNIIGVSESTVGKWLLQKSIPRMGVIELLANYFHIEKSDLIEPAKDLKPKPQSEQTIQVPLVGYIAAGSPILAEENIEDYYNIDKRIKADFCLKVKGDSMIGSHILDGDIAFIKSQPTLENGEIGAVLVSGNTATLKKVYVNKDNVILQPSNVNYQPIIISGQDLTEFRILGKLVANLSPKDL